MASKWATGEGFSERTDRVCRTHPCLLIHPSAWRSLCIARCTLAILNTLIEAREPPRCFERLRVKTGWQTPRIRGGLVPCQGCNDAVLFYVKRFKYLVLKKKLRILQDYRSSEWNIFNIFLLYFISELIITDFCNGINNINVFSFIRVYT